MSIKTTNPATNKVLKSFDEMTDKQVEAITISNSTYMNENVLIKIEHHIT
jgi:succinate-semialdehyde dehydrogenase/glutarate-semialdehyde dehydrogenase